MADGTWYPEACISLGLEHIPVNISNLTHSRSHNYAYSDCRYRTYVNWYRLHSSYETSIVGRTIEYLKDRTEAFYDYYPCMRDGLCNLGHVHKWLILFIFMHNNIITSSTKFDDLSRWKYL
jgi:hypothetical protein